MLTSEAVPEGAIIAGCSPQRPLRAASDIAVLIPAYNPSHRLVDLVRELAQQVDSPIVVVNDGGDESSSAIFDAIRRMGNAAVVANAINLGKGAALKHGINFILTSYAGIRGVVTADADGQHAVKDIVAIVRQLKDEPEAFVLGARKFGPETPLRSRFGNEVSRVLYQLLLGLRLKDTQTGLRGLPISLATASLKIRSNRYEFETEQLSLAASNGLIIREIPIETIYEDQNASSHFNPVFDSARIYFVVLRYALSSLATTFVDLIAFLLLIPFLPNVIWGNLASRAVAISVQYLLLQNFVFRSHGGIWKFLLFAGYVATTGLASGALQSALSTVTGIGAVPAKIMIETVIFIFNFLFLRDIMFRRSENDSENN